jgi:hypothetical protein
MGRLLASGRLGGGFIVGVLPNTGVNTKRPHATRDAGPKLPNAAGLNQLKADSTSSLSVF